MYCLLNRDESQKQKAFSQPRSQGLSSSRPRRWETLGTRLAFSRLLARPNSPFPSPFNACNAGYGPCDIEHHPYWVVLFQAPRQCSYSQISCVFFSFFFFTRLTQNSTKKMTNNNFKGGKVAMLKCFCCLATKLFILPWLRDASRLDFKKDL